MIFLKFYNDDGDQTLVNLGRVAHIVQDGPLLNITTTDANTFRVAGSLSSLEHALARVGEAPVTILEL